MPAHVARLCLTVDLSPGSHEPNTGKHKKERKEKNKLILDRIMLNHYI